MPRYELNLHIDNIGSRNEDPKNIQIRISIWSHNKNLKMAVYRARYPLLELFWPRYSLEMNL